MTLQETEPKLPATVGGPPVEAWVGRESPQGLEHWKVSLGITPFGLHNPTPGLGHLRPDNSQGGSVTPPISR